MTAPKIGVVGATDIARTLSGLGFDVITDAGFREAATAISHALKDGPFPLIVADSETPVVVPWTTVTLAKVSTLIILDTHPGVGILPERADLHLPLPATFNDLLAKLGYAGAPAPLGDKVIAPNGALVDEMPAAAPEPAPLPIPASLPGVAPSAADPAPDVSPAPVFTAPERVAAPDEPAAPAFTAPVFAAPAAPLFPADAAPAAPVFGAPPVAPSFPVPASTPFNVPAPVDAPTAPVAPASPVFGAPTVVAAEPTPVAPAPVEEALPAAPAPAPPFGGYLPASFDADEQPSPAPTPVPHAVEAAQAGPAAPAVYTPPAAPPQVAPNPAWDALVTGAPTPQTPVAPAWQGAAPVAPAPPVIQHFPDPEPTPQRAQPNLRLGTKHGEVIFSTAGKGGVGKTSSAILLAECAAEQGLQAVLVDANRGQADIRKYLRLGDTALRSAYDAYQFGDPSAALLKPHDFAHLRAAAKLDVPDFCIVLGPPSELAGSRYASASIYGDIIDYARSIADVVIVDTQIMEAPEERTDLWRDTVIPMLGGDAWMLGITDESAAGIENLHERISELRREGVTSARSLILASQFLEFGADEISYFQKKFDGLGSFIGNTGVDDDFSMQLNLGKINGHSPSVRPAIENVLLRVTNRADLFSPRQANPGDRRKPAGKFGFFGKKKSA